jgi:hypothetical protein
MPVCQLEQQEIAVPCPASAHIHPLLLCTRCRRIKQTKQRAVSVQQQQRHLLERMYEKAAREAALQAQLERQVAENQKLKQEHERVRCVAMAFREADSTCRLRRLSCLQTDTWQCYLCVLAELG